MTGNKVLFRIDPPRSTDRSWAIEMVDDNTVMLYRGDLPLVGTDVLDLIGVLGLGQRGQPTSTAPVQAAAVLSQGDANNSIVGIVLDSTKAVVPGAAVTATSVDTGAKLTTVTDRSGSKSAESR